MRGHMYRTSDRTSEVQVWGDAPRVIDVDGVVYERLSRSVTGDPVDGDLVAHPWTEERLTEVATQRGTRLWGGSDAYLSLFDTHDELIADIRATLADEAKRGAPDVRGER